LVSPPFGVIDLFNDATECCTGYKNPYLVIVAGFDDTSVCIDCLDSKIWNQTTTTVRPSSVDIGGLFIAVLGII